jgi:hypothetical protein
MANYRPIASQIASAAVVSATIVTENLSTTSWKLALLRGTALFSDTVLASGAVAIWESTNPTTADPSRMTFTDASGVYGITVRAGVPLVLKFFDN